MSIPLFKLTTSVTLWSDKTVAFVIAEDEYAARLCMTGGSDSLWSSVETCEQIATLEITPENLGVIKNEKYCCAGGIVIG
jgi:hypothetical protein